MEINKNQKNESLIQEFKSYPIFVLNQITTVKTETCVMAAVSDSGYVGLELGD